MIRLNTNQRHFDWIAILWFSAYGFTEPPLSCPCVIDADCNLQSTI